MKPGPGALDRRALDSVVLNPWEMSSAPLAVTVKLWGPHVVSAGILAKVSQSPEHQEQTIDWKE